MGHRRLKDRQHVFDVVRKELVVEVRRHPLLPDGSSFVGIGAQQKSVPLATQVESQLRIADQREDRGIRRQLVQSIRHHVLVAERHDRKVQPRQPGDLSAARPCGVDDDLGCHPSLVGVHCPGPVGPL